MKPEQILPFVAIALAGYVAYYFMKTSAPMGLSVAQSMAGGGLPASTPIANRLSGAPNSSFLIPNVQSNALGDLWSIFGGSDTTGLDSAIAQPIGGWGDLALPSLPKLF